MQVLSRRLMRLRRRVLLAELARLAQFPSDVVESRQKMAGFRPDKRRRDSTCGCYPDKVGMQVLSRRLMRLQRRVLLAELPSPPSYRTGSRSLSRE